MALTTTLVFELLDELDVFLVKHLSEINTDPDGFYDRLQEFVAYLVCRSIREGRTVIWLEPSRN